MTKNKCKRKMALVGLVLIGYALLTAGGVQAFHYHDQEASKEDGHHEIKYFSHAEEHHGSFEQASTDPHPKGYLYSKYTTVPWHHVGTSPDVRAHEVFTPFGAPILLGSENQHEDSRGHIQDRDDKYALGAGPDHDDSHDHFLPYDGQFERRALGKDEQPPSYIEANKRRRYEMKEKERLNTIDFDYRKYHSEKLRKELKQDEKYQKHLKEIILAMKEQNREQASRLDPSSKTIEDAIDTYHQLLKDGYFGSPFQKKENDGAAGSGSQALRRRAWSHEGENDNTDKFDADQGKEEDVVNLSVESTLERRGNANRVPVDEDMDEPTSPQNGYHSPTEVHVSPSYRARDIARPLSARPRDTFTPLSPHPRETFLTSSSPPRDPYFPLSVSDEYTSRPLPSYSSAPSSGRFARTPNLAEFNAVPSSVPSAQLLYTNRLTPKFYGEFEAKLPIWMQLAEQGDENVKHHLRHNHGYELCPGTGLWHQALYSVKGKSTLLARSNVCGVDEPAVQAAILEDIEDVMKNGMRDFNLRTENYLVAQDIARARDGVAAKERLRKRGYRVKSDGSVLPGNSSRKRQHRLVSYADSDSDFDSASHSDGSSSYRGSDVEELGLDRPIGDPSTASSSRGRDRGKMRLGKRDVAPAKRGIWTSVSHSMSKHPYSATALYGSAITLANVALATTFLDQRRDQAKLVEFEHRLEKLKKENDGSREIAARSLPSEDGSHPSTPRLEKRDEGLVPPGGESVRQEKPKKKPRWLTERVKGFSSGTKRMKTKIWTPTKMKTVTAVKANPKTALAGAVVGGTVLGAGMIEAMQEWNKHPHSWQLLHPSTWSWPTFGWKKSAPSTETSNSSTFNDDKFNAFDHREKVIRGKENVDDGTLWNTLDDVGKEGKNMKEETTFAQPQESIRVDQKNDQSKDDDEMIQHTTDHEDEEENILQRRTDHLDSFEAPFHRLVEAEKLGATQRKSRMKGKGKTAAHIAAGGGLATLAAAAGISEFQRRGYVEEVGTLLSLEPGEQKPEGIKEQASSFEVTTKREEGHEEPAKSLFDKPVATEKAANFHLYATSAKQPSTLRFRKRFEWKGKETLFAEGDPLGDKQSLPSSQMPVGLQATDSASFEISGGGKILIPEEVSIVTGNSPITTISDVDNDSFVGLASSKHSKAPFTSIELPSTKTVLPSTRTSIAAESLDNFIWRDISADKLHTKHFCLVLAAALLFTSILATVRFVRAHSHVTGDKVACICRRCVIRQRQQQRRLDEFRRAVAPDELKTRSNWEQETVYVPAYASQYKECTWGTSRKSKAIIFALFFFTIAAIATAASLYSHRERSATDSVLTRAQGPDVSHEALAYADYSAKQQDGRLFRRGEESYKYVNEDGVVDEFYDAKESSDDHHDSKTPRGEETSDRHHSGTGSNPPRDLLPAEKKLKDLRVEVNKGPSISSTRHVSSAPASLRVGESIHESTDASAEYKRNKAELETNEIQGTEGRPESPKRKFDQAEQPTLREDGPSSSRSSKKRLHRVDSDASFFLDNKHKGYEPYWEKAEDQPYEAQHWYRDNADKFETSEPSSKNDHSHHKKVDQRQKSPSIGGSSGQVVPTSVEVMGSPTASRSEITSSGGNMGTGTDTSTGGAMAQTSTGGGDIQKPLNSSDKPPEHPERPSSEAKSHSGPKELSGAKDLHKTMQHPITPPPSPPPAKPSLAMRMSEAVKKRPGKSMAKAAAAGVGAVAAAFGGMQLWDSYGKPFVADYWKTSPNTQGSGFTSWFTRGPHRLPMRAAKISEVESKALRGKTPTMPSVA